MLRGIKESDQDLLYFIQSLFDSWWMDSVALLGGNIYFWTPLIIFLIALLYLSSPKTSWAHLLFGIGSIVIAYQLCYLLAIVFKRPPPYLIEQIMGGHEVTFFHNEYSYSFPDWAVASFTSVLLFTYLSLKEEYKSIVPFFTTFLFIMGFFRMIDGLCYPIDFVAGILVGIGTGLFMARFSKSMIAIYFAEDS